MHNAQKHSMTVDKKLKIYKQTVTTHDPSSPGWSHSHRLGLNIH